MAAAAPTATSTPLIALVGNPNCGKTALFNRLTGARQKVGNYAGVTVERKEGQFISPKGQPWRLLDLPGAYSLLAATPDEVITRDVIAGTRRDESPPVGLVCVVDATNLRLNLRMVLELQTLGVPMVLVINMMDEATRRGIRVDTARLHALLQGQLLFSAMRLPLSQRNAGGGHDQRGAKRDEAKNESGRHR